MQLPPFRNEPFTDFSIPANKDAFTRALQMVREQVLGKTWPCWIGGEQVVGTKTFETHDPGETTRIIGRFQELTAADADRAVDAAHAAFPQWAETKVEQRVRIVLDAAQRLRERKHEFSAMLCFEVGKSWAEGDADTAEAIDFLEYYAGQMLRVLGEEARLVNAHTGYAPASANPLATRPTTKFQARGERLGHGVWDLVFLRR